MMEEILPNIQTTKTVSKFSIILTYTASPSFCCPTSEKNNFTIFFTIFTLFSTSLWSIQQTFRDNKIFFFLHCCLFWNVMQIAAVAQRAVMKGRETNIKITPPCKQRSLQVAPRLAIELNSAAAYKMMHMEVSTTIYTT